MPTFPDRISLLVLQPNCILFHFTLKLTYSSVTQNPRHHIFKFSILVVQYYLYASYRHPSVHSQPMSLIGVNSVNITACWCKLTLFFSAIPLSRFSLKMSRFFWYFELVKMRRMRSAQRQVELRRLGNQLPVLGKASSLCKILKLCVFWPVCSA